MMTRVSFRPNPSTTGFFVGFAALTLLAMAGCDDKHIGRRCSLSIDGGTDATQPTNVSVNSEALECPSRVCLLPNQERTTDTGPFCTDSCSSDDDCADGEKRDMSDPNDKRCEGGFVSRAVTPNLTNVALSCQKVCTCRDFLLSGPATT